MGDNAKNLPDRSIAYLLTFNNPDKHGVSHDSIKEVLSKGAMIRYWCMSDEIGAEEHTLHIHLYIYFENSMRFSTLKKRFPSSHIDYPYGTPEQNRDYVFKEGKWLNDPKGDTNLRDTHEEYGVCPIVRPGKRNDLSGLYDLIKEGLTDYEILEKDPNYIKQIERIGKVRKTIIEERIKNEWRDLDVTYVWGVTGSGKTRGIMDEYGYSNVYRVLDYSHPFDAYRGQDVILFEEFRSSLRIEDMLKYLDGYPVELPCRYYNQYARFTKVYICTNIDLRDQYPNMQREEKETWDALLRRIDTVKVYTENNKFDVYDCKQYMKDVRIVLHSPFDEDEENESTLSKGDTPVQVKFDFVTPETHRALCAKYNKFCPFWEVQNMTAAQAEEHIKNLVKLPFT